VTKKGLVEWLKAKALSSSPSTAKKKQQRPGVVVSTCNPSTEAGLGYRLKQEDCEFKTTSQKKHIKKDQGI
jgi:hypothetical protein